MSGKPTPEAEINAIIGGVAAGESAEQASNVAPDVAKLAERLDLLVADFGQWSEYKAASAEYIREFAAEVRWHRRIRACVVAGSATMIISLSALLVVVLCRAQAIFGPGDRGHGLTALIVASIGGSVVITISATKGAFATLADRNEGLPMPEHIKELVELGRSMFGKG